MGRFLKERQALKCIALAGDPAILTALGNDFGYESIFARQVEAYGEPGGVLLGISTSGNSANVVAAFKTARTLQMTTGALTGTGGGKLAEYCDILIDVPSTHTPYIQQIHLCLYHYICEAVEAGFPQREIQESAYQYQKAVERKEQVIVGVNKYAMEEDGSKINTLLIDEGVRDHQLLRLEHVKSVRDRGAVANSLEKLKQASKNGDNTMPSIIEAVAAYATVEEICVALRDVYGIYEEPAF